jgi:DNA-binding response OmpR family regulator
MGEIEEFLKMQKILYFDDCRDSHLLVERTLSSSYEVICVNHLESPLESVLKHLPDLILMDIGFPSGSGLEACALLTADPRTADIPLLFLSARDSKSDVAIGLKLGADDYISKPFDTSELLARIESKLRRISRVKHKAQTLRKGDVTVDLAAQRVYVHKDGSREAVRLTPHEFKILVYLWENEGQVLSREQILQYVWADSSLQIMDRSVDTHISALRKKLPQTQEWIEAIYGAGYRFDSSGSSRLDAGKITSRDHLKKN